MALEGLRPDSALMGEVTLIQSMMEIQREIITPCFEEVRWYIFSAVWFSSSMAAAAFGLPR